MGNHPKGPMTLTGENQLGYHLQAFQTPLADKLCILCGLQKLEILSLVPVGQAVRENTLSQQGRATEESA